MECLGSGGAGEVYRALQYPLERLVALKLLRPELGRNPAVRRRFAREARAVAALNHPNVTTIYDFGLAEDDTLFLAMEFVDGHSLRTLISEGIPTIPTLIVVEQILSGLAHAHARGIIHRDLKPENVLVARIDAQLRTKIVDFGIAHAAGGHTDDAGTSAGKVIGTPSYMSPEQAQGDRNLNSTTDIYNVGLMLYEAATGRHPFAASTPAAMMLQHVTAPVPRPLPRPGFLLPEALEEIILAALVKDPAKRVASAADFKATLAGIRQTLEDSGHQIYLPVAPIVRGEAEGRITLVEGTPRVVSASPIQVSSALEVPFIGRDEERKFLLELHNRVVDEGLGSLIFVEGETGVGKTRLATWFKEHVVENGSMRSVAGRYLRETGGLRGVREIVEQLFGTRGLNTADASARVASQLVSMKLTDARDAGLLIEMLRPPTDSDDDDNVTSRPIYESLFAAVTRVLEASSRQQPLLVILDDVQWAGTQTTDLLAYLAAELKTGRLPVMVVCTLRSEELSSHPKLSEAISDLAINEREVAFRRRLRLLNDSELRQMIRHVIPATDSLEEGLLKRSEGNPLYALQIIRYLIDEELIASTETGSYIAIEDVKVEETVPPNLADLLQLRLNRLARRHGETKPLVEVIERAAILGIRFPYDVLLHMVNSEDLASETELEAIVDILTDEGLLSQNPDDAEDTLDFNHTLVRDVLLKRMAPRRSTRRMHRLAAEAKRAFFVNRDENIAAELSAHYELGHDFPNALKYAHVAGTVAERMHRPADSVTAWQRCLRLYDRVESSVRKEIEVPEADVIQAQLGELLEALGWYETAEQTLRELLPGDGADLQSEPHVRAAIVLGAIALKQGRAAQSFSLFESAKEAATRLDCSVLLAKSLLGLAQVSWHRGRSEDGLDLAKQALRSARDGEDRRTEGQVLWFMGDVHRLIGNFTAAIDRFQKALAVFESIEDLRGLARCVYGLAVVARTQNDLDKAEELYQRAFDILEPLGVRRGLGHCLNGLGEVARFRGRLAQARELYKRAVDTYQSAGLPTDAAVSLTNLGLVARDAGDLHAARDAMERALRVAEETDYEYLTLGIAFNLSWVYALLGERSLCGDLLDKHLDRAVHFGLVDPDFARPLEGIAEVLDAAGESKQARRLYARAKEMWAELRRDRDALRVTALLR